MGIPGNSPFSERLKLLQDAQAPPLQYNPPDQESEDLSSPFAQRLKQKQQRENESLLQTTTRNIASGLRDVLSVAGGSIGDLREFSKFLSGITPKIPGLSEPKQDFIHEYGRKFLEKLPTTEDVSGFLDEITGGYTKPEEGWEQNRSDILKTISGRKILGPRTVGRNIATRTAKDIGIPLAAELAKEGTKKLTDNKLIQEGVKIGTMVLGDLRFNNPNGWGGSRQYAGQLLNEANRYLPDTLIPTNTLRNDLMALRANLIRDASEQVRNPTIARIDELLGMIDPQGNINARQANTLRRTISEEIDNLGGYNVNMRPNVRDAASAQLQNLRHRIGNTIYSWADQNAPQFSRLDRAGNEAFRVHQQTNRITNFIRNNFGRAFESTAAKILFHGTAGGAMKLIPGASAVTPPLYALYQSQKYMQRIYQSPVLRDFYLRTVQAAANNNKREMQKYMNLLDKRLAKEESKDTGEAQNKFE